MLQHVAIADSPLTHAAVTADPSTPALRTTTLAASLCSPEPISLDACGLACPGPILELRAALPRLAPGGELRVTASDPGFIADVRAFAGSAGLDLVSVGRDKGVISAVLRRPASQEGLAGAEKTAAGAAGTLRVEPKNNDVAIVVFSGDLDKVGRHKFESLGLPLSSSTNATCTLSTGPCCPCHC